MKPSFFTLFKRGRYFRALPTGDDEDSLGEKTREEAERFAMAAMVCAGIQSGGDASNLTLRKKRRRCCLTVAFVAVRARHRFEKDSTRLGSKPFAV